MTQDNKAIDLLRIALSTLAQYAPENDSVVAIKTDIVRYLYGDDDADSYQSAINIIKKAIEDAKNNPLDGKEDPLGR